jgi:hypothetical protein
MVFEPRFKIDSHQGGTGGEIVFEFVILKIGGAAQLKIERFLNDAVAFRGDLKSSVLRPKILTVGRYPEN